MCGRYYSRREKDEIAAYFRGEVVFKEPLAPNFNIAPTTFQPAVRLNRDGAREMVLLRWGLLPFFAKNPEEYKPFSTFNARTETILEALKTDPKKGARPSAWREPMKKRRCLIPADGFYEWPESEKLPYKGPKHPRAFTLSDGSPMAFAGLWDAWREPDGKWLQSFSIVTTEANELLAEIHPRMPVILHPRDWDEWLSREDERLPVHLLRPYEAEAMRSNPCNPAVGNVRNNGPEMLNSA
jgi:putative SOS response-associated peptidase YedK